MFGWNMGIYGTLGREYPYFFLDAEDKKMQIKIGEYINLMFCIGAAIGCLGSGK